MRTSYNPIAVNHWKWKNIMSTPYRNNYFMRLFFLCLTLPAGLMVMEKSSLCAAANSHFRESIISVERERVISRAETFLHEKPVTVTAAFCPRSAGTIHDYYSEGDYWWPNPANPDGPYIRKDGLSNPENFNDHRRAVGQFSWMVGTFSSAYLLTGDKKYADAALTHLRAWFIEPSTRMNPHFLYAQAIKGICTGRGIGIIDAIAFIEVARSVAVLERSPYLPGPDLDAIKDWYRQFLTWLSTHPYGVEEMNWKNNHGTWWHAQAAAFASLLKDEKTMKFCAERFREILLPNQMAENGSFPLELERTKPYSYSMFNLDGMATVAWILSDSSSNLWQFSLPDGRGMKKGVEFIIPFTRTGRNGPMPKMCPTGKSNPAGGHLCFLPHSLTTARIGLPYGNPWMPISPAMKPDEIFP